MAGTVIVITEVAPVAGLGANAAVTPVGRPSTVRVTPPVKLVRARSMVLVPFAPRATVNVAGVADNPTLWPGATTVNVSGEVTAAMPVPVARIVIGVVATGVVPLVVSVSVVGPVPVLGFGTKFAVTPAGRPSAAKVTLPVKFVRARAMLVLAFAPCAIDSAVGVSVSPTLDVGAAVIVIGNVAVWSAAPADVPVSVSVAAPNAAFAAAVTVSVELVPLVVVGESVAVTPVGAPVTASATLPVRLLRVMFTVLFPLLPCGTERVGGVNASEKENAVTVSVYVVDTAETPGPVALTVIG